MKILHIFNQGGVSSTLAPIMDENCGTVSRVVTRTALNRFRFPAEEIDKGAWGFVLNAAKIALKADVVHVNGGIPTHNFLKKILSWKDHVMHFHGSESRGKKIEIDGSLQLYSSPDMIYSLPSSAIYLPNPVDRSIFAPQDIHGEGKAMTFSYNASDVAEEFARQRGLELTVLDRRYTWNQIPDLFSHFEYYIDSKRMKGELIKARSMTALQALACGLKVIEWDGSVSSYFPEEHDALRVAFRLYDLYRGFGLA
ncbi:MAG TPA: hypothetical protein VGS11_10715 [Candidatus Bathyarchaeia archaeon]|nr:hypothetical protein [Candidatus Bathyarchaeia archaeon]